MKRGSGGKNLRPFSFSEKGTVNGNGERSGFSDPYSHKDTREKIGRFVTFWA